MVRAHHARLSKDQTKLVCRVRLDKAFPVLNDAMRPVFVLVGAGLIGLTAQ